MKKVLFVCTGNTCRSPMAEMIFKKILKQKNISGVKVSSAGVAADCGSQMNPAAQEVLRNAGYKHASFKSKQITQKMLEESALIVTMTDAHKRCLGGAANVHTLHELTGCGEISDPYGHDETIYLRCMQQLQAALEKLSGLF